MQDGMWHMLNGTLIWQCLIGEGLRLVSVVNCAQEKRESRWISHLIKFCLLVEVGAHDGREEGSGY